MIARLIEAPLSFDSLAILSAVAFLVPFLAGLAPRLRLPAIALEILAGFAVGPHGLKWASVDAPVQIFSTVGLAALLFLAGFEFDIRQLQGPRLGSIARGFGLSLALGALLAFGLSAVHLAEAPFLLMTIFTSTSLGLIVPMLKDAREESTAFGQLIIAGAALGEIGPLILLSLIFSASAARFVIQIGLLAGLLALIGLLGLAIWRAERTTWLSAPLLRLSETSAQLRVRGVVLLLSAVGVVAYHLGFEGILGAFLAGALLSQVSGDALKASPLFRQKLEAVGFGVFIPIFFISSGMKLDLGGLLTNPASAVRVPIYLAALLIARGLPALFYRQHVGLRRAIAAGLLQATSLSFVVAASGIGMSAGLLQANTAAALVGAGLLSALICPLAGFALIGRDPTPPLAPDTGDALI